MALINNKTTLVSAMELPCYVALSMRTVKLGSSDTGDIQNAASKINFVLNKNNDIEFNFEPRFATWSCQFKKTSDAEKENINSGFELRLWQREGDLLLETICTSSGGGELTFSEFYHKFLVQIVTC